MDKDIEVYDFGNRLRQLREDKKITQKALAERIGMSKETLYRYESNLQTPGIDNIRRLARELCTTTDYLLGMEDRYTIALPKLTNRQRDALNEFVAAFITGSVSNAKDE